MQLNKILIYQQYYYEVWHKNKLENKDSPTFQKEEPIKKKKNQPEPCGKTIGSINNWRKLTKWIIEDWTELIVESHKT